MEEKVINLAASGGEPIQCHFMPCRIEHSGHSIKAREYFWPTIRLLESDNNTGREPVSNQKRSATDSQKQEQDTNNNNNNKLFTASFRGRPLQGRKLKLPLNYEGQVLNKTGGGSGNIKSVGTFKEFTYWNWDELPSDEDSVVKSLQWINISNAIHAED